MKYSYRVRLAIVKRVKQGEAISHLSEAYSVSRNKIREWVQMWDKYGCSGLKYQPHSRPTRALKEKIVRLILRSLPANANSLLVAFQALFVVLSSLVVPCVLTVQDHHNHTYVLY